MVLSIGKSTHLFVAVLVQYFSVNHLTKNSTYGNIYIETRKTIK
nr:MAG TPA: hypothetical protein [Caudoviricetes sp.]